MTFISTGREVIVDIPPDELENNPVAKYQGQRMKVARRIHLKKIRPPYYELVGARSKYGIAYGFLGEWLKRGD